MSWQHINEPPLGTIASSTSAPLHNNSTNHSNGRLPQLPHGLHTHEYRNMRGIQIPINTFHMPNTVPILGTNQRDYNPLNTNTSSPDYTNNNTTTRFIPVTRETNTPTPYTGDTLIASQSDDHTPKAPPTTLCGLIQRDNDSPTISIFSPDNSDNNNTRTIPYKRDNTSHMLNKGDTIIASHSDAYIPHTTLTSVCGITHLVHNSKNISTPSPDQGNPNTTLQTKPLTRENTTHTPNAEDTIIASHSEDFILNTKPAPAGGVYTTDQSTHIASFSSLPSSATTPPLHPSNTNTITTLPHPRDNNTHMPNPGTQIPLNTMPNTVPLCGSYLREYNSLNTKTPSPDHINNNNNTRFIPLTHFSALRKTDNTYVQLSTLKKTSKNLKYTTRPYVIST